MVDSKKIKLLLVGLLSFVGADAVAADPMIGIGEHDARFQSSVTTLTADSAPTLHEQVISGTASLVEGDDFEDVFPSNTAITQVVVTIVPPSGQDMVVAAISGPSWTENAVGAWQATFAVPAAAGGTTTGQFYVTVDPDGVPKTNGGVFKVKKAGT